MQEPSQNLPGSAGIDLPRLLMLVTIVLFAVALDPRLAVPRTGLVCVAVSLVVVTATLPLSQQPVLSRKVFWMLAAVVGAAFLYGAVDSVGFAGPVVVTLVAILGALGLWVLRLNGTELNPWIMTVLCVSVVATIAIGSMRSGPDLDIDVIFINEAAAEALANGENPYVTAVVADTSPYAEDGAVFEGYVYPPLALVAYSSSEWAFGDTRWANWIAIAVVVALLAWPPRARANRTMSYAAAAALAVALLPNLAYVLIRGWTEPVALPFLLGGALLWKERPLPSAVLIGLAFATKQYFLVLAPLVLMWNDEWRWRRAATVGSVVLATMLPALLVDARAFWDAAIAPALAADLRPDSINLVGLGIEPPQWLAVVLAVGLAVMLGRRGGGAASFLLSSAAVLSVTFLLGFQAFVNYWFLVAVIVMMAFAVDGRDHQGEASGRSGADSVRGWRSPSIRV